MIETAHILVVDDDAGIRRLLQVLLSENGYRVLTSASAEEALAYLDLVTPDLILMDLDLPGMSGVEAISRIKADTHKPFIPVMLVTAHGDKNSKVQGLDAGADDFVVKPPDLSELLARVRALLRLQRSRRSLRAEQRKTELLLHLTRALGTTLELDTLLTQFLDKLSDAVGATRASIILTIDEQPRLYSSSGNRPITPLNEILRDGIAGWVLRSRETLVIAETRTDQRWIARAPAQQLVRSVLATPIVRDDRELGVITLVHHTPGYFHDEHVDLIKTVATQCGFALENAALLQLTRRQNSLLERRAEELQRLNQISRHLSELMRPDQLLRQVVTIVHENFAYPRATILMNEGNELVVRAVAGFAPEENPMGSRHSSDSGFAGWAIAHREALCVNDIPADARANLSYHATERAILVIPIVSAGVAFGVLEVTSPSSHAFGDDDIRLLETLTGQIGVALQNARLFDAEQERVRQLERVNQLSVAVTAQIDPTANLQIAAIALARIFAVEVCGIFVTRGRQPGQPRMALSFQHQQPGQTNRLPRLLRRLAGLAPAALDVIPDVQRDSRLQNLREELDHAGIHSLVLAPLNLAGRSIGSIVLNVTGHVERFGHSERTLLETIASLIAQVHENARLYREVEDERSTLNAVLGGAADMILLIDPQERLMLANQAAVERLNLEHAIGRGIDSLELQPELLAALNNGTARPGQAHEVGLVDGTIVSVSVSPVQSGAGPIGRVAVVQDITAIKELERREQERLRSVFRRYVSPQVVEEVLADAGDFGVPAERDIVVLIADLRGYTTLTEGLPARMLVDLVLNRYFTAMTEALYRHGGTIDKFMGDGIIGLFGVPIARPDDIQRSLLAAIEMQQAFEQLRQVWRAELGRDIGMGIGMSYGRAVVGNIGSTQRLDYTVIGDVVNTASRLNGVALPGEIIVSYKLVEMLPDRTEVPCQLVERGRVLLKGKQEPHLTYAVVV